MAKEKRGRKSKYETNVKPYFKEIEEMCRVMTEKQIAQELGVAYSTFCSYKKEFPEFSELLKKGRRNLVIDLRSALIRKATGFTSTSRKAIKCKTVDYDNGKRVQEREEIQYVDETEYYPPDTAALNLALKNYDKENWANDPQTLDLKKKELKLREKQIKSNNW